MDLAGFAQKLLESDFIKKLTNPWVIFGFAAQFAFFMRFVIQWIASERRGRSYVPVIFWYFSLLGGVMLFVYACKQQDPVFMAGQGLGCVIYIRNLVLIYRRERRIRNRRLSMAGLMEDGLEDDVDGNGDDTAAPDANTPRPIASSSPMAPRRISTTASH